MGYRFSTAMRTTFRLNSHRRERPNAGLGFRHAPLAPVIVAQSDRKRFVGDDNACRRPVLRAIEMHNIFLAAQSPVVDRLNIVHGYRVYGDTLGKRLRLLASHEKAAARPPFSRLGRQGVVRVVDEGV